MTKSQILAAAFGAAVGVSGASYIDDALFGLYDDLFPVAEVTAKLEFSDHIRNGYRMTVNKFRDCELLRVMAYDVDKGGLTVRLKIEREDSTNLGLPPGRHVGARLWYVTPPPSDKLQLFMIHDCSGRQVRTGIKIQR